jgi:hypothetical protein
LAREAKAARSLAEAISEREGTAGLHRLRGYRIKVRLNGRNPRAITGDRCTSFSCGADIPSGAKEAAEKLGISCEIGEKRPSGAKARVDPVGFMRGLKPPPPSGSSFSAACKARIDSVGFMRGLKPRVPPDRVFPRPVKPALILLALCGTKVPAYCPNGFFRSLQSRALSKKPCSLLRCDG